MVKKNNQISDEESKLFRESVKGVRPIKQTKSRLQKRIQKPALRFKESDLPAALPEDNSPEVSAETILSYSHSGISYQTLRKLKRGQFPIEISLDLHGKTVNEAERTVHDFLQYAREVGIRSAIIIHGKGHISKSVLKNKLNRWLRANESVLAFHSALPKDGGTGAVYLLLKSNRQRI